MFNNSIKIISLLSLALMIGCSDRANGPAEIVNARAQSSYHIVKKGETIEQICKKYKISRADLIALNNLKPPYKLFNKQRVKIKTIESSNTPYYAASEDLVVKNLDDDKTPTTPSQPESDKNQTMQSDNYSTPIPAINDKQKQGLSSSDLSDDASSATSIQDELPENTTTPIEQTSNTTAHDGSSVYDWPVTGKVVQTFGQKGTDGAIQQSLSIQAPAGTKVKSVAEGEVVRAGKIRELQELGNMAIVEQKDGNRAIYGFLKEVYVKKGQTVGRGTVLGTVGVNKAKNKAMLVFQLRAKKGGKSVPVDPMKFLPSS